MSKTTWNELKDALRQRQTTPEPQARDEFWAGFRERATETTQDGAKPSLGPAPVLFPRLAVLAAAAAVVIAGLLAQLIRGPEDMPKQQLLSRVEEIEVFGEYSSVMIVQDADSGGTLVWVSDLEGDDG